MNKKLIGNTAWYFLGTAISAIIGFISAPILTRVLSTEVYAQYKKMKTAGINGVVVTARKKIMGNK